MYRDGANYKNYNELVFENPDNLSVDDIDKQIRKHLIDNTWFVADNWHIPNMFFEDYTWNNEIDHTYHEYCQVIPSDESKNQPKTILEFLKSIEVV